MYDIIGMRLKFATELKDQTVKETKTARFEIELSHDNVPVTWYKNEIRLHPSRTVIIHVEKTKHILEIKEVTLDDTCQIRAETKGISTMAKLLVIGNPLSFYLLIIFKMKFVIMSETWYL